MHERLAQPVVELQDRHPPGRRPPLPAGLVAEAAACQLNLATPKGIDQGSNGFLPIRTNRHTDDPASNISLPVSYSPLGTVW
ncbi:hypothetical protein [Streptomyces albospinus]|uniref:hypothetical protein n=1 Tax=Streptomyces albospinus TaxID=285515 RepID=UPI0016708E1E|nr:hypothetical protein [Streptomyces albospinus]